MRARRTLGYLLGALLLLAACDDTSDPNAGAGSSSRSPENGTQTTPPASNPTTQPTPASRPGFSFAAIGDSGRGTLEQVSVAARMCSWRDEHPFDLVVTTGDNVYPDGSPERFESTFFDPYQCLFDESVDWHASLGNHDWATEQGRPELDEPAFGMNGPNYVVRKSGVRFVIANSNQMDRVWLREALVAEPGDRWTIVVFHHPVYSPGIHGSTPAFADLPAIFEDNGVDLVLNGHDHFYSVTKPENGIRYVVTGGGGAQVYPCLPSAQKDVCEATYHFLYVETDDDKISVRAVPIEGPPIDRFTTAGLE